LLRNINDHIQFIEEDLRGSPVVEFHGMLKALLALLYMREIEPTLKDEDEGAAQGHDAAKKFADDHYNILIAEAIKFSNDKRSADLKNDLRDAYVFS
jgi:hypothetical protein